MAKAKKAAKKTGSARKAAASRKSAKKAKATRPVSKKAGTKKAGAKKAVKKAQLKTQATNASATAFLDSIPDETRRKECKAVAKLMRRLTGAKAKMWGPSIVGFGSYTFEYASGRAGDWFLAGFAPRKNDLTLYVMSGFKGREAILKRLGKHKTGKACLYLKRLEDVDMGVLEELIASSIEHKKAGSLDR